MNKEQRRKTLKGLNKAAQRDGGRFFYRNIKQRIYREDTKNAFGSDFIEDK